MPGSFASYDVLAGGGDLTHDGQVDLLVRQRSTGERLHPARTGRRHVRAAAGPFGSFASAKYPVVGNVAGGWAPDALDLSGDAVRVWVNPGTFDLGRPIDTGVQFTGANRILGVGDWIATATAT